MLKTYCHK